VSIVSKKSNRINVGNLRLPYDSLNNIGNIQKIVFPYIPELEFWDMKKLCNKIQGNRAIIVPKLNRYSIYGISNIMRKGSIAAKIKIKQFNRTFYIGTHEGMYNLINNFNSKKSVKISLSNILTENNFQY